MQITSSSLPHKRKHLWTNVHSSFAVMGGFAIDTVNLEPEDNFLPHSRTHLALTCKGLLFLAKHEPSQIPDLPRAQIEDKSKANVLAKILVCFQALWFCVQCLSRLIQGLPISLLELNSIGHCVCTLFICLMWWNKPVDVVEPILIPAAPIRELLGFMCMSSPIEGAPEMNSLSDENSRGTLSPRMRRSSLLKRKSDSTDRLGTYQKKDERNVIVLSEETSPEVDLTPSDGEETHGVPSRYHPSSVFSALLYIFFFGTNSTHIPGLLLTHPCQNS